MNFRNRCLIFFLLAGALQITSTQFLNGQDLLVGVVSNKLMSISPVNGTLTELADLSPALQPQIRGITYHPERCLFYCFIDELTTPKLVSITLDGTTSLIGNITLPSNMVTIVESISYNDADGQVYLSARINQPAGPGTYFSATILQVNVDNAVCSLVGNVNTAVTPDIDAMAHYNGDFIMSDISSAPFSTWARFYRFPPSFIGSGSNLPEIYAVNDFQTTSDLSVYQDELYFTANRRLYKGDPDNFIPVLVGQMYTAAEYGGALLRAIATVSPSTIASITLGPDLELCTGETATLEIAPISGASIIWSNGVIGPVNPVSSSGTYWVEASQGACASVSDTVVVNFNNEPMPVNLGPDLELCNGETATFQIPEETGASILWSNGATGPAITVNSSGTYWVQVTLGTCAPVSDTVVVNFNNEPMPVNLGPDLELCTGEMATLQIPEEAGASILWSNGATGPAITVNSSGTYWVQVTLGTCAPVSDTVVVSFTPVPLPVSLGPGLELCNGETATLQIPEETGASILWSNGATGPAITVNSSGTYWVQVTLGTCAPVSDTVVVNFNNEPMPVNLGPDLELCAGETATLQIPQEAGASILWSNGATESAITVNGSGTYWVQVTIGTCAPVSDTVVVNFTPEPMPVNLGPDLELCSGESATLQISEEAGASILWSSGFTGPAITVNSSGTYWVQVTLGTCAPVSDTVVVNFNNEPMPVNLGPDLELCAGETATLQIPQEAGASILWSNGASGPAITVSSSGTYWVQVTIGTCAPVSDTVVVNFTPEPMPVNLGPDLELCSGESATLQISEEAGASILWSSGFTGPAITVNSSGTYWVQVTLGTCAPVSDTVVINFNNEPMPVNLGPDLELCAGETATLQIPAEAGASILWSNGATESAITVNSSGTYWVQVTLGTCAPVTDTVVVSFTPGPMPINLGPDLELCDGETATLQIVEEAGASIVWSNGATGPAITVNSSGTYWVQASLGNCGIVSDTVEVNFIQCPDLGCTYKYFIPNAFSPNEDGINDKFEVYINPASCMLESIQVQIFDRWGELVYKGSSLSAWDGVFRGKKAMSGVYVYMINMAFNRGGITETVFEKGDVTLIR